MKIKLAKSDGVIEVIEVFENETLYQILKRVHKDNYFKYLGVKVNNKLKGLCSRDFEENDRIEFIDISHPDGHRIYVRTLSLIYVKACKDVYKDIDVSINYSLNKGLYTELQHKHLVTGRQLNAIKQRMQEIIDAKKHITTNFLSVDKAIEVFSAQGMMDKVEMLKYWDNEVVRVYELDGYYDTFYGYLAPNTGFVDKFDLRLFYPGIILNFPTRESNFELPEYIEQKKLSKVFKETEEWGGNNGCGICWRFE